MPRNKENLRFNAYKWHKLRQTKAKLDATLQEIQESKDKLLFPKHKQDYGFYTNRIKSLTRKADNLNARISLFKGIHLNPNQHHGRTKTIITPEDKLKQYERTRTKQKQYYQKNKEIMKAKAKERYHKPEVLEWERKFDKEKRLSNLDFFREKDKIKW